MNPLSTRRDTQKQRRLYAIVERRKPDLLPIVASIRVIALTLSARDQLQELLADELVEAGLDQQDEPTAYGLEIEDLIDWVGKA